MLNNFSKLNLTPKGEQQVLSPPSVDRITDKIQASKFFQGKISASELAEAANPHMSSGSAHEILEAPKYTVDVLWEAVLFLL
jgi:hypothetical protein